MRAKTKRFPRPLRRNADRAGGDSVKNARETSYENPKAAMTHAPFVLTGGRWGCSGVVRRWRRAIPQSDHVNYVKEITHAPELLDVANTYQSIPVNSPKGLTVKRDCLKALAGCAAADGPGGAPGGAVTERALRARMHNFLCPPHSSISISQLLVTRADAVVVVGKLTPHRSCAIGDETRDKKCVSFENPLLYQVSPPQRVQAHRCPPSFFSTSGRAVLWWKVRSAKTDRLDQLRDSALKHFCWRRSAVANGRCRLCDDYDSIRRFDITSKEQSVRASVVSRARARVARSRPLMNFINYFGPHPALSCLIRGAGRQSCSIFSFMREIYHVQILTHSALSLAIFRREHACV
ncbi:hypothetical protein EVAR_26863_1 [Eumeta japonica]|uniref:Uncharacterized protein n=1 Tax=Eumeta variegata TaxID=151549 RepID=A0A4C1VZC1_EUMVA|nr:hypothetical protein EVAR_26863_1 [Eumeta japonica]